MEDVGFEVTSRFVATQAVVAVTGELDVATADGLRAAITDALAVAVSGLVLDLSAVTFLDSTALGVLISTMTRCQEANLSYAVVVVAPSVRKVMTVTGLDRLLPLSSSLDNALGASADLGA